MRSEAESPVWDSLAECECGYQISVLEPLPQPMHKKSPEKGAEVLRNRQPSWPTVRQHLVACLLSVMTQVLSKCGLRMTASEIRAPFQLTLTGDLWETGNHSFL